MNDQLELTEIGKKEEYSEEKELAGIVKNVFDLLNENTEVRNSDKVLAWEYWKKYDKLVWLTGNTEYGGQFGSIVEVLERKDFLFKVTPYESIARAARKLRERFPHLRGRDVTQKLRKDRQRKFKKIMTENSVEL